jgi:Protein of unknown function (DUF3040)
MGRVDQGRTMLSEYEQRELRSIEQMLLSDSRFSATLRGSQSPAERRSRRLARVLLVSGVLIMVAATFLGLGAAFVEGLGLAMVGSLATRYRPRFFERRPGGPRTGGNS